MGGTVCFTGPLPKNLYGYKHDSYIPLVNAIEAHVTQLYNLGYTRFISGGAQGVDQLAFWAVNRLKGHGCAVENIVYIPFKGQDSRWSAVGLFSKQEYNLMLHKADNVRIVSQINSTDYRTVGQAMHARNHAMVDDSDIVFGVYFSNSWRQPNSSEVDPGTAKTLRYAAEHNKYCMVLEPNSLTLIK